MRRSYNGSDSRISDHDRVLAGESERIINQQPTWGNRRLRAVCAFDERRDQYLLRVLGWSAHRPVRATTVHAALQDGRIRIEEDNTEHGIATDLTAAGVPQEDIILAWQETEPMRRAEVATT